MQIKKIETKTVINRNKAGAMNDYRKKKATNILEKSLINRELGTQNYLYFTLFFSLKLDKEVDRTCRS